MTGTEKEEEEMDSLAVIVRELLDEKDYPGDEVVIETILKERPDWTRDQAVDYLEEKKPTRGEKLLQEAIERAKYHKELWAPKGVCYPEREGSK